MRLPAALGLGLILGGAGDPPVRTAIVSTAAQQTLRGWGMSLAWEANAIYGGPSDTAQVPMRLRREARQCSRPFPTRPPGG